MNGLAAHIVAEWPWLLRVLIGHAAPLLAASACLWQLRRFSSSRAHAVPFLAAITCLFVINWLTVRVEEHGDITVVAFSPVSVLFAVTLTVTAGRVLDARAVFAGVFLPLYFVDVARCAELGSLAMVGGAGPLDALVLFPCLAVLATRRFALPILVR